MTSLHLLRPCWLLSLVPLSLLFFMLLHQPPIRQAWHRVCDSHLLPYLMNAQRLTGYRRTLCMLATLMCCLILSLSGPTYTKLSTPTYQKQQAHVVLLDVSNTMLAHDLAPTRLQRAKFKLHDLLTQQHQGQFALIAYTGEPFVVSPLTDDGQTIDALIASLSPEIMPVGGNRLDSALIEAQTLLQQSGIPQGHILVLTAEPPSTGAIEAAHALAKTGTTTSILPLRADQKLPASFSQFAKVGTGKMLIFSDTTADLNQWLSMTKQHATLQTNQDHTIPTWRDDGRWLLIPALLLSLILFRRDGLQRIRP